MGNAVIHTHKMWDDKEWVDTIGDKWQYAKVAEQIVCEWVARRRQMIIESMSQGCDSRYDVIMSGKKIEVKIQKHNTLCIEFARANGNPSGIAVSESDYYLMVNPGSTKIPGGWSKVGKVRLIPTRLLRDAVNKKLERTGSFRYFKPGKAGPGGRCIDISPKSELLNDGWLGDVGCTVDENTVSFDFGAPPAVWSIETIGHLYDKLYVTT